MCKFIILSALVAVASALPTILHGDTHLDFDHHLDLNHHSDHSSDHHLDIGTIATPVLATGIHTVLHPETIQIHEPTIAKVGDIVQKIPTAVSHQRISAVVKHSDVVTPIVAPAVKTYTSHVLKAYQTPVVYAASAPVLSVFHHD